MEGLPARTAREVTLPDGTVVWVKTLNDVEHREAAEESDFRAAREVRPYRENGDRYVDVLGDFEDLGEEEQAAYIVQMEFKIGEWQKAALEKHPDPVKPEHPAEMSDDAWIAAVEKWEEEVAAAEKKRSKFVEKQYEGAKAEARAMDVDERVRRCARLWRDSKFREKRGQWFTFEVLARAVRRADDHAALVYVDAKGRPSAEVVKQLADDVQNTLIEGYFMEIDPVASGDIPTSPVAS